MNKKLIVNISTFFSYWLFQIILFPIIVLFILAVFPEIEKNSVFIGVSLIYMIIIFYIYRKDILDGLNNLSFKQFGIGFSSWIIGFVVMGILNAIILSLGFNVAQNQTDIDSIIYLMPIYMIFSIIIFAPIVEEFIFRLSISKIIKNKNIYIIASGFIFGFIHISSYLLAGDFASLVHLLPYSALGISFAYTYSKTENILVTMIMHFMHNFIVLLLMVVKI
ncbi:MAG: lysostaphin resistance A-like protein [Bacilli bacterium]